MLSTILIYTNEREKSKDCAAGSPKVFVLTLENRITLSSSTRSDLYIVFYATIFFVSLQRKNDRKLARKFPQNERVSVF